MLTWIGDIFGRRASLPRPIGCSSLISVSYFLKRNEFRENPVLKRKHSHSLAKFILYLVCCCGHNITVFKGISHYRSSNKTTYVSHIHHEKSTNSIGNLPDQIKRYSPMLLVFKIRLLNVKWETTLDLNKSSLFSCEDSQNLVDTHLHQRLSILVETR